MTDEKTVYIPSRQKAPKLFGLWQGVPCAFSLSGNQTLGRPSRSGNPDLAVPVGSVSRRHGAFSTTAGGCSYCDLGSSNGTYRNGSMMTPNTEQPLRDGDVLRIHGRADSQNVLDVLLVYSTSYRDDFTWKALPLGDDIAEIGVGREDTIALQDRSVSHRHASFFRASGGWAIIDHNSLNGVRVNNRPVSQPVYLSPMDVVQISDYLFFFTGDTLIYQEDIPQTPSALTPQQEVLQPEPVFRQEKAVLQSEPAPRQSGSEEVLSISIEERNVWRRMKKKTLLRDIRLEIPGGSMVLVLGGSGAGKTTFMNAVMGYEPADGMIRYKNVDIYAEYEKMKYEIGYVPQQDLLRMSDTVYDTLLNAGKMKLPASLTQRELEEKVHKTMHTLGLEREQASLVGKLSGGQRKRLSIAVEYIANPSLFFLDEPDSGLDGTMARALMENLRTIADEGKIVITISHSPDRAFELFDQVIVLAKDSSDDSGRLVFFGSPKDACAFFNVDCLERIVKRINRPDEGGDGLADVYIRRYAEIQSEEVVPHGE